MADFANLVIGVDTSGLKRGERDVKNFGTTSKATEGAIVSATKALALFGGAFAAARAVSSASQAYASMANSMRILGFEAEAVAAQINKIGDIAQRTRSPLEATAQLYQRISIAAKDLGASQQQVLRFTENVGLALAQQGGSAAQASGALLQLSQAMSGGTVRAEEFNSILEGAFPIAQAAANAIEGAAGSVGQLRNMVIAGEVSSREFFNAILSSSEALEAAFGNTVPTVSQALTVLSTSFTLFVGQADSFLGASSALAEVIILLSGNIDILAGVVAAIAVAFGVRYVAAIVVARLATFSLTGALVGLKAALFSTGIGAVVVLAGGLAGMFSRLVSATGSFGGAMEALGVVAKAVLADIGGYFSAVGGVASSVAFSFTSSFLSAFANTLDGAYDFVDKFIIGPINALEDALGLDRTYSVQRKSSESIRNLSKAYSDAGVVAAEGARKFYDGATRTSGAIEQFKVTIQGATDKTEALEASSLALSDSLGDEKGAAKAAKDAAAAAKELADEIERLEFDADPLKKYNAELEALNKLSAAGLSDGAYAKAVQDLNDGLSESYPLIGSVSDAFGDFVAGGLQDFKGFVSTILGSFKSMLSQMIATAARNKIMIGMGIGGSSVGTVANAATGGGAGLLGGLGASAGLFASSVGTGLSVVGSGFMAGGVGGAATAGMGAIGGGIGAGGAMGFGTALGAALPFIGAAVLAIGLFSKKTKLLDEGLQLTVNGFDSLVESFSKTKTSRFFGLSSSTRTSTSQLDAAASSPFTTAIDGIQKSVLSAAAGLGVGADAFSKFSFGFKLSLKGLTEEQKMTAVTAELAKMGDAFAAVVPGISSLNELLAVSAERYNLQNRVLELQGKGEELLARQREAQMNATNDLNKAILQQIFNLEDTASAQARADILAQEAAQAAAQVAQEVAQKVAQAAQDAAQAVAALVSSINENDFATGVDFRRGLARASSGISSTPQQSQAEMLAELKALNARIDVLQSTSEITANSSAQTAENTDFSNALTLDAAA
jgi:tape measure domain-containing protein